MSHIQHKYISGQEEIQETTGKVQTSQGLVLTGSKAEEFRKMALDVVEGNNEVIKMLDDLEEEKERKRLKKEQEEKPTLEEVRNILKTYGNEDLNSCIDAAIESGDINTPFLFGRNAIIEAAEIGDTLIIDILIKLGANVNSEDDNGNTPLIIASREGHYKVVEKLLKAGAKADHKNNFGQNAIDVAKDETISRIIFVYLMIKYGENFNELGGY